MLINKHNHNHDPRHTRLPKTSRSHEIHPSASRHALSSSQFSAEKNVKGYVLRGILLSTFRNTSSHLPYIFFSYILVQKKMTINSNNFRKHSKTWRYWEICLKEDLNYQMSLFFPLEMKQWVLANLLSPHMLNMI